MVTEFEAVLLKTEKHLQINRRMKALNHLQNAVNEDIGYGAMIKLVLLRPDRVLIQIGHTRIRQVHIDDDLSELNMIRIVTALIP